MSSVKNQDTSISVPATGNAYDKYRVESIRLLNELMKCPKELKGGPVSKPNPDIISGVTSGDTRGSDTKIEPKIEPKTEPKIEPIKSSTPLQHNGNVGGLEDLILFLIKSPTTPSIKMKLNDVYKIFNPTARDIVSNRSIPTPTPVPSIILDPVAT